MRNLNVLLVVSCAAMLAGCDATGSATKLHAHEAKASAKPRDPLTIQVSDAELKQLKVGKPAVQPVAQELHAAARIEANAARMVRVGAPVAGRIMKIDVLEGQHVHAGEVLATIHSAQLSDAEFSLLKAYSQHQLDERAVDRAEKLVKADVIGSAELLRRKTELDQHAAELAASRSELQVLGIPKSAVDSLVSTGKIEPSANIVANIGGTVLERKVTMGQIVQQADPVFVVADLSKVWLVADVPEEEAGNLQIGKSVEATVVALSDTKISGRLSFVSSIVNPDTRTVQVRMDLPNPGHKYKPNMLATMIIESAATDRQVVPLSAIVRNGDNDAVFMRTSENTFALTPVQLGEQIGDQRVVLSGLVPNREIILDGAFNLNNERLRQQQMGEQ